MADRHGNNGAEKRRYPLKQLYFYMTEGCNLRCRHCWLAPKYQNEKHTYAVLDLDLFRSIVEQARQLGLVGVKLTGGEPLMHPQIREVLAVIREQGVRLIMETNGLLCTREMAQEIACCPRPFVSVSLDGADAETHEWVRGVPGCFEASTNGVRYLAEAGLKPQVIMSVMRHNKDQVEAVVRLAESLGAGSVKFNVIQPMERGGKLHETGQTVSVPELVALGQHVEGPLAASTPLRLHFDHPSAFRRLGRIFGDQASGCGICGILNILGVLPNGAYALCGIGETIPELVFGHAAKDSLADVWLNSPVLNDLREGLPKRLQGICAECVMQDRCLGGCIAQNYYSSKSLWAPYWFCEEARKAGLFPESRMRPAAGKAPASSPRG